jgi:hypothetical protein
MATRRQQDGGLFPGIEPKEDKFEPRVPDGTPLNEAVSILIKELRRGMELEALYWARQIEVSFHKYLWRRLAIFACEDVGLGDPQAIVVVESLEKAYARIKTESKAGKPDGNLISMACLYLARATKNREADHLKNVAHVLEQIGWRPSTPEYAIDAHTARGRMIYKTQEDRDRGWFLEWSKVMPEVGPYDARLWHLRRLVDEGTLDTEFVEDLATKWDAAGQLVYGMEGRWPLPRHLEPQ